MRVGGFGRGGVAIAALALALGSGFATPRLADASLALDDLKADQCGGRKTLIGVQQRICPSTKRRPAVVVRRACCANAKGKVRCRHFPHCPRRSPS